MATDAPEAPQKNHSEISPEFLDLRRAEIEGDNKPSGDSSDPRDESLSSKEGRAGGFYNPHEKSAVSIISKVGKHRKAFIFSALGVSTLVAGVISLFLGLGSMNLTNFMANVESRAFLRYQVDMDGRSSKWINAYVRLRMGEVEGGNPASDNVYFKASRVDNNNPMIDWYKTLRSSTFEEDVFEKHGIQFQSVAEKNGSSIRFRTAMITLKDRPVVNYNEMNGEDWDSLTSGDFNRIAGSFDSDFDIEVMKDPEARKALRLVFKEEYPHWWQTYKRKYLRQDMQNRLGIRKWSFFETTRNNTKEGYLERRNKIISKVIESSTPRGASQNFLNCLFGISKCNAHGDPAHPQLANTLIEETAEEAAKRTLDHFIIDEGGTKAKVTAQQGVNQIQRQLDAHNDSLKRTQAAAVSVSNGAAPVPSGSSGLKLRAMLTEVVKRGNQLAILDGLMRFNGMLRAGDLSKMITATKTSYAMGLYSTFQIAEDQMKTGEMNGQEFGAFMGHYGNLNNGEGWNAITKSSDKSKASAATSNYEESSGREEFCSESHQKEMLLPQNKKAAEEEFQYLCPEDVIGSRTNAKRLEDAWNKSVGWIISPLEDAYNKTPLGTINQGVNWLLENTVGKIATETLAAAGLTNNLESMLGYVAEKALRFGGANMDIDEATPSGRVGNLVVQGGSSLSEMGSRMSGAALTDTSTASYSSGRVMAYQQRLTKESSVFDRYLSTSNPRSFAALQIPGFYDARYISVSSRLSHLATSILSLPSRFASLPVYAETPDGYAASKLADIETYDFPPQCINADPLKMTPASATNADDLGYIAANELNWTLMSSKKDWYSALYQRVGEDGEEKAKLVWNCALLDNAVRGGIGGAYGYKGMDYMPESSDSSSSLSSVSTTSVPSGSAQELAKLIVDSKKITGDARYYSQIQNIARGDGSCPVDERILALLVGLAQEGHTVYLTSLNRRCTGVLTASGPGSHHYRDGGGHAVDIGKFNGETIDGKNSATLKLLNIAVKYLPEKGTEYGQVVSCGSGFNVPAGSVAVTDSCNHQHIGVSN